MKSAARLEPSHEGGCDCHKARGAALCQMQNTRQKKRQIKKARRIISFFTKCQTSEWIQEQASGGV